MTNQLPDHPNLPELDPDDVLDREVIEPPAIVNENSLVRRIALQILYEVDSAGHPVDAVLNEQMNYHTLSDKGATYLRQIVTGVVKYYAGLDRVIRRFAPEWPVEQLAIIDRTVLRIAIFELYLSKDIPIRVVIDEAVELAKWYGADGSSRFINGVIGAVNENRSTVHELLNALSE